MARVVVVAADRKPGVEPRVGEDLAKAALLDSAQLIAEHLLDTVLGVEGLSVLVDQVNAYETLGDVAGGR